MIDTETIKSIIQALRCTAENADQRFTKCNEIDDEDCVGCPYRYEISGMNFDETSFSERTEKICDLAANAFESLIAEVERLNAELAAYENTGLEPEEIQEAVNLFPWKNADIPTELKNWVERCTWHVERCNEQRKELDVYNDLGTVEELAALVKRNTPTETIPSTVNRGIGVTGEYDIDYNLLCPECGCVVGDYETEEQDDFCRVCGQKLKLPKEATHE